jgi:hypothetical protein
VALFAALNELAETADHTPRKRARFAKRPYLRFLLAFLESFLYEAPLREVADVSAGIDGDLEGKGFDIVRERLRHLLVQVAKTACNKRSLLFVGLCASYGMT